MTKAAVTRTAAKPLTERTILAMRPGQKKSDGSGKPGTGRLVVRARERQIGGKGQTVREFFFRYWDTDGAERSLLLGLHGVKSLEEARRDAEAYRDLVARGIDPRFHREQLELANREAERRARDEAAQEALKGTFRDLLEAYTGHLAAQGKVSARDAQQALSRHVLKPFPALATRKARDVTADDITDILARMISMKIERRTNIVRSLLRAAFAFGAKQDNDPERKAEALRAGTTLAKRFGITGNPVADVARIGKFDRAGDRTLSDEELRGYWQALAPLNRSVRDALKVALLLGGQRMSQLLRATWNDYDPEDRTLRLVDSKGRGGSREHVLPVSDRVASILDMVPSPSGDDRAKLVGEGFIFSTTTGKRPIDLSTLSNAVSEIGRVAADSAPGGAYTAADLRRTVETRLAAIGVPKEHRALVLSHGRTSDVQAKHYERHDDIPAKLATLARWEDHLFRVIEGEQTGRVVRGRFRPIPAA